ncbi:MAG: tyrosine-type recombinase/integrase, partial [Bacteroidota bacterium]|nr:tyrosine-type recombinase/integrase [Bacteroidota bacterium]
MSKTRRGRNEGMVRWREDKQLYEARYPVGKRLITNKKGEQVYRTKYDTIYGKKKTGPGGVVEKMRNALTAIGKGEYVKSSGETLLGWCKEWYESYKLSEGIKTHTQEKYQISLKRLKILSISDMLLSDLTQESIQKCYIKMKSKYATGTIKATHSLINGALEKAEELRKILNNPARKVTIPHTDEEDEGKIKALTNKEYELFMEEMSKRSSYFCFADFMGNTGLRPGEAVALNRRDLDIKNKYVTVNKTFVRNAENKKNSPKTRSSKRTVPVPESTIRLMKEYMLRQKNQKPDDPLFQSLYNNRLDPKNALRGFKKIGESVKINKDDKNSPTLNWINLHTMRHTFASRLFKEEVNVKVISELLGHKKISTTLDIYVDFIDNIIEESVQVLNNDVKVPNILPE